MITVRLEGAEHIMRLLTTLPREVTANSRGGMAALAMRKGARPMLNKAKENLDHAIQENGYDESTGLLQQNLKLRRHRLDFKGEKFTIGVGNKRYPKVATRVTRGKDGKWRPVKRDGATTKLNGARLEYGTEHQKATPWLVPAFEATAEQVIHDVTDDLKRRVDQAATRLLRGR